jgi:acyl-coenzyme A thioesterase PaaI-like protein
MVDLESLAAGMLQAVPFARTLGVQFVEVAPDGSRAVVRLPDAVPLHNHVGGPHAGAMFALGETASGAVVMASFAEQLTGAVPLAVRAEIEYRKLAKGEVLATATLAAPGEPAIVGAATSGAATSGAAVSGAAVSGAAVSGAAAPSAAAAGAAVRARVVGELAAGGRPEFEVSVDITRADGAVVTHMVVVWTLRPNLS